MKDWSEYEVNADKFPYPLPRNYEKQLQAELDEKPLSKAARVEAEKAIKPQARAWFAEQVKPYNQEKARLSTMFWEDAREDLGYAHWNEGQINAVEGKAYDDGHAYGFSEIYSKLVDLVEFVKQFLSHTDTGATSE